MQCCQLENLQIAFTGVSFFLLFTTVLFHFQKITISNVSITHGNISRFLKAEIKSIVGNTEEYFRTFDAKRKKKKIAYLGVEDTASRGLKWPPSALWLCGRVLLFNLVGEGLENLSSPFLKIKFVMLFRV